MNFKLSLLFSIYIIAYKILADEPPIQHYPNITLPNCGLRAQSIPRTQSNCFKWLRFVPDTQFGAIGANGREAYEDEFPWVALFRGYKGRDTSTCTASLLNQRWLITAAHCLGMDSYKAFLKNRADSEYWVSHVYPHPQFNPTSNDNDIALVKLDRDADTRPVGDHYEINAICLPENEYEFPDVSLAAMAAWGYEEEGSKKKADRLRVGVFETYITGWLEKSMFIRSCRSTVYAEITHGDFGGALFQYSGGRAVMIGVAVRIESKFGDRFEHCTGQRYSFIRVSRFVDWINKTIRENN